MLGTRRSQASKPRLLSELSVRGAAAPRFSAVRELFQRSFTSGDEWGAALCVWHQGEIVIDLWGGLRDRERRVPWNADTLSTAFSATKGLVALCFLMLADRGELDYDAPIARYWPEFGQGGKDTISVRTLLNHRSGLLGVDRPVSLQMLEGDAEDLAGILAAQRPAWPAGESQGYHGVTYGLYAAELFRRAAGCSLGEFIAREISGPLKADVYLGLPPALERRVATNYPATTRERIFKMLPQLLRDSTEGRVFREVVRGGDAAYAFSQPSQLGPRSLHNFNSPRVHAMQLGWANALVSARGLCRVYAALAAGGSIDSVSLVKPDSLLPLRERQSWSERDRVLRKPLGWTQGFLKEEVGMFSPNTQSFGHPGAGGALGWCDPVNRLAIAYLPNKMAYHIRSPRARALCAAIYACVR